MTRKAATLTLALVDDDDQVRRALGRLLRSHGYEVQTFDSAEAYREHVGPVDCVILDAMLPGVSGIDLERQLAVEQAGLPVVFITAHDDLHTMASVQATHRPLVKKPLDEACLLDAIAEATASKG